MTKTKYIKRNSVIEKLGITKDEFYKLIKMGVIIPEDRTSKQNQNKFIESKVLEQFESFKKGGEHLLYLGEVAFLGKNEIDKHLKIFNEKVSYQVLQNLDVVYADIEICKDFNDYYSYFISMLKNVIDRDIYILNCKCGPSGFWENFIQEITSHGYNLILLQDYRRK